MTEQYRARPDEWETVRMRAGRYGGEGFVTILELRARVEALEAAQQPAAPATDPVVKDSLPTDNNLVRRVARAIFEAPSGCGWENEARAAIKEVAAWMREYERVHAEAAWAECLERAINPS